jgi:DNA-directed RNA polymerase specialized sigma24 family protein
VNQTQDEWSEVWAWIDVRTEEARAAFRSRLAQVCTGMLRRRGRECWRVEAEDVVNEVFVRLPGATVRENTLPDGTPEERFAYICAIARNIVREQCREGWRELPPIDNDDRVVLLPVGRTLECHRRCYARLPPHERHLILQYADGSRADREALAASLSISVGALRVRAHGIRRRLLACLAEFAEEGVRD